MSRDYPALYGELKQAASALPPPDAVIHRYVESEPPQPGFHVYDRSVERLFKTLSIFCNDEYMTQALAERIHGEGEFEVPHEVRPERVQRATFIECLYLLHKIHYVERICEGYLTRLYPTGVVLALAANVLAFIPSSNWYRDIAIEAA